MVAIFFKQFLLPIALLASCVLYSGCDNTSAPDKTKTNSDNEAAREFKREQDTGFENYTESGDLGALKKRGVIRFVSMTGDNQPILPREAIVNQTHRQMAEDFATKIGLSTRWFVAQTPEQALRMVINGEVDVVAENISITPQRQEIVEFTIPVLQTSDVLVSGKNGPDISSVENLAGTELIVLAGSTYAEKAHEIVAQYPEANLSVREVYLTDERDTLFDMVANGNNAVTILHKNLAEETLKYRDDLKIGVTVSPPENIAWAIRKDSVRLKNRIDNFLTRTLITAVPERTSHWYAIKKSGVLRFATYNGPTSYYLWKGVLRGFDYDMAKAFADKHKLQLQVVVVPNEEDLVDWVADGRADIAGASTTITQERIDRGVMFSIPFIETTEKIISNRQLPQIETLADLEGRTITLRAYSSFIETARTLREHGIDINIQIAPADMSFEQVLNKVAKGEFEATIEDGYIADIQAALRPELVIGLQVSEGRSQGWMIKRGNKDLLREVDRFLKRFSKSEEFDKLLAAYFEPDKHLVQKISARVIPGEALSPYDHLVQVYALEHNFDWRLIVAQMWQESNFNPRAVSPVGAQGLLQVMPRTGEDMGYPPPLFDPEKNVKAGIKYLEWVRNRFKAPLPASEQLWFTLASYNAGIGHLFDAQRLAEKLGLDPGKWFGNVEVAMLKLSEPRYFQKARYGYVRGSEPVAYVRKISNLYKAYTNVATGDIAKGAAAEHGNLQVSVKSLKRSCQYDYSTPSADVHPPRLPAHKWPLLMDGSCPRPARAKPSFPGHWLWPPSPPLVPAAGWNLSESAA
ncbi:transporter substrate-binding domain-containing protein [Microbulbifer hydrolyticus]|uniref:Membrane-bound lytic murein transglycosylase F n=1 Tax=Microbulbifer hydrolyticus TaxID=48074 RepID=A0A6P1TCY9_9GAMM|nr:membrane-bound lytic murein transglycosylase F [Microbulbifer hydrolyticus]QHQ39565.1 transporter substrate-binding domain-containing protein [Microbulbifer hydrolyticus]